MHVLYHINQYPFLIKVLLLLKILNLSINIIVWSRFSYFCILIMIYLINIELYNHHLIPIIYKIIYVFIYTYIEIGYGVLFLWHNNVHKILPFNANKTTDQIKCWFLFILRTKLKINWASRHIFYYLFLFFPPIVSPISFINFK